MSTEPQPAAETPDVATGASGPAQPAPGALDEGVALAQEAAGLFVAIARLGAAELDLSGLSVRRSVLYAVVGIASVCIALVLFAVAAVIALAQVLESVPLALVLVGLALVGLAAWLGARSVRWRRRIGFPQTRSALAALRDRPPP